MALREMAWVWETRHVYKPCTCSTIAWSVGHDTNEGDRVDAKHDKLPFDE